MSDTEHPKSPDEDLADKIAEALVEAQLVAETQSDNLSSRIASGNMTAEDWQVFIESALPEDKEASTNGESN